MNSNKKNDCVGQIKPVCGLELAGLQALVYPDTVPHWHARGKQTKGAHGDAEAEKCERGSGGVVMYLLLGSPRTWPFLTEGESRSLLRDYKSLTG